MPAGRPANTVLRNEVNQMAQAGLSGAAIARQLGITRQRVHWYLKGKPCERKPAFTLACNECGLTIARVTATYSDMKAVFCPRCLLNYPQVHFGIRFRLLRLAKGWTIAEVARRCGIPKATLGRYELGTTKPRPTRLEQLAAVFGPANENPTLVTA
jgi:transcriptional regulator with XRE-family HTH domain